MAEITKRETRNRGERRPVIALSPPHRVVATTPSKPYKRKAPGSPPPPEPIRCRDPPDLPTSREEQGQDLDDAEWKGVLERLSLFLNYFRSSR